MRVECSESHRKSARLLSRLSPMNVVVIKCSDTVLFKIIGNCDTSLYECCSIYYHILFEKLNRKPDDVYKMEENLLIKYI